MSRLYSSVTVSQNKSILPWPLPQWALGAKRFIDSELEFIQSRGKVDKLLKPPLDKREIIGESGLSRTYLSRLFSCINRLKFLKAEDFKKTLEFLFSNKFLIPLMEKIVYKLQEFFNTNEIYPEVIVDPDDGSSELFLSVVTKGNIDEALLKLEEFDRSWFLNLLPKTKNKLNITVITRDEL